jgi:hypothetical protein
MNEMIGKMGRREDRIPLTLDRCASLLWIGREEEKNR